MFKKDEINELFHQKTLLQGLKQGHFLAKWELVGIEVYFKNELEIIEKAW